MDHVWFRLPVVFTSFGKFTSFISLCKSYLHCNYSSQIRKCRADRITNPDKSNKCHETFFFFSFTFLLVHIVRLGAAQESHSALMLVNVLLKVTSLKAVGGAGVRLSPHSSRYSMHNILSPHLNTCDCREDRHQRNSAAMCFQVAADLLPLFEALIFSLLGHAQHLPPLACGNPPSHDGREAQGASQLR